MDPRHSPQRIEPAVSVYRLTSDDTIAAFKAYFPQHFGRKHAPVGEYAAFPNDGCDDGTILIVRVTHPVEPGVAVPEPDAEKSENAC
jgi:hypothetical protein